MTLSVVIITHNEEANLPRTLASVAALVREVGGEIIVVDSGSTDRTPEIARQFGAKIFCEPWKGFAAQKNSALEKASGEWVLSLDADEELDSEAAGALGTALAAWQSAVRLTDRVHADNFLPDPRSAPYAEAFTAATGAKTWVSGFYLRRKNFFLGRWIRRGGFWPDPKLRLFRRHAGRFPERLVHEDAQVTGSTATLSRGTLLHHAYPTLDSYLEHMNRYSSLGAEMAGASSFSVADIVLRPLATFLYNYVFRLGFLDGREGLLLHLYHACYVSWKYAKAWELRRRRRN